jgi:signal transduction histidine kinase/ActR/RegA family two-component response regulator
MQLEYNIYFELAAAFFMFLLTLYVRLQFNMEDPRNRIFFRVGIFICISNALDVITAITISNGSMIPPMLNTVLNTIYFGTNGMLSFLFLEYSLKHHSEDKKRRWGNAGGLLVLGIYMFALVINFINGWVFSFDEAGEYIHGPLYLIVFLVPYLFFAVSAIFMLAALRKFNRRQKLSVILYVVLSMSGAAIQLLFLPNVLINIFTISLAYVVILFSLETPEYQQLVETMEELRIANEKAQVANEAKSRFLARMSHEIRTPINAVLGMDEMILRESGEEQIIEYARNIESAGNTLLTIINDILDFSKIESGRMELYPTEYELKDMLEKTRQIIAPRADEKQLQLLINCEHSVPRRLVGDELRIRQILMNLLTNAVKYTKEGTVTLQIKWQKKNENEICLLASVEDTGIGIAPENQEKLFTSFERVDVENTHNIEGTGLGLAITKQMVELMQGKIGVYSTVGKGSLFYVELPQKVADWEPVGDLTGKEAAEDKPAEHRYKEKFRAPQAKILVVDDLPMNLLVMQGLLKKTEVVIDTALSGAATLQLCAEQKYDMIFLDQMMPEMDGMETLHRLRETKDSPNADTPVIVLTANAIDGAAEEYLAAGFDDYVSKPATGEVLENVLLKYLPEEKILDAE